MYSMVFGLLMHFKWVNHKWFYTNNAAVMWKKQTTCWLWSDAAAFITPLAAFRNTHICRCLTSFISFFRYSPAVLYSVSGLALFQHYSELCYSACNLQWLQTSQHSSLPSDKRLMCDINISERQLNSFITYAFTEALYILLGFVSCAQWLWPASASLTAWVEGGCKHHWETSTGPTPLRSDMLCLITSLHRHAAEVSATYSLSALS